MTDAGLVAERRGHVLVLRLDRPEAANALTIPMLAAIGDAVAEAERDPDVRAIVLVGTGERAFCSGMDLRSFGDPSVTAEQKADAIAGFGRLLAGEVAVPVVGAANATAVGGGFELLLGCDVVVASSAAEFGLPEVTRGLFPGGNGTTLATRIPLAVAMELALTGERISASRALDLGLVNAVAEPADVLDAAVSLADRISANAPLGVAAVKELLRLAVVDPARHAQRLAELQRTVFQSEDAAEGARAFAERRAPVWQGR
jgi:enoyl-CoA hydratase/carnithine racemase